MNEKKNSIILIIIFYTILVLPTFIYPLIKTKMDNTNYENRVLSNFDIVYNSGIRDLPSNFDLYYKDNLPFKNELQKIRASIKYMFKASTDSKVIIGENGWLFFNSGVDGITDEIGDYNKTTRLTQEQYDLVNENLNFINDKLAQKKINFYVFIPSNKTSIYPEYMPKIYNRNNEVTENKVDALVKNIKETTKVNVIYPKEELIKYKTIADTYYKYDTHWNAFGGLVGVSTILENVENEKIKIEDLTIEKENISFGDLAKMNQTLAFTDEDTPIVKGYYDDVKSTCTETEDVIECFSDNARHKDTLLLIGDSFRTAMVEFLSRSYKHVVIVYVPYFNYSYIEKYKPNTVIYEVVERNNYQFFNVAETFK